MKFAKPIRVGSVLFFILSLGVASFAQRQPSRDYDRDRREDSRWEQLGRATVDRRNDHDRIFVNRRESFRALQLGVKGGAIDFQRVVVHFENGEDTELEIRERIEDRGKTRVIDLPGDRRRIRSVEFWFSKGSWRSRPSVNLWGRR
jgi:hypothetical protein